MDQMTGSAGNNTSQCPSIDEFRNQVYSTAYSIITIFGLIGNGFALVVLIRTFRQSSPFHVYMLNLAVSDLLFVSTLPLRVLYHVSRGHWYLGDFLCRISTFALYVNLYCGILFMAAMSVTRFLAIVFPVQNIRLATICRSRLVCVCIWIFVCATSSPFLISGQHTDPKTEKIKCFEPPNARRQLKNLLILNYLGFVLGFALPFLIIIICYAGIIRTLLSRHQNARRNRTSDTKAIRMIVIVMLTFLVSFMPYHVQRSVHLSFLMRKDTTCEEQIVMQKSVVVTLCLAASNSCFDPLLYFFSGEGFRTRLRTLRRQRRSDPCNTPASLKQRLNQAQGKPES